MQSLIFNIPVFGWMLREAVEGTTTARVLFIVNCVLIWILAIAWFGYPAIIIPALAAVAGMFAILLVLSWPYHDH